MDEIKEMCEEWVISNDTAQNIMNKLSDEIKKGLSIKTHNSAIVKCFVTYVHDLPSGKERGKFLALDLGGTNFRICFIILEENHFDMNSKIYVIPEELMVGKGVDLFDHIATCLSDFVKENNISNEHLPLGFTFSFPVKQLGLTKGILERWTKGFNCSGVVGEDIVTLLKNAIVKRNDMKVEVCAILNDTTGTLMSCAWKNSDCKIGLIVGTGSNACYIEKMKNVETFIGVSDKDSVIINTEWGAFGDDGSLDFIRNQHDLELDYNSLNPGKQIQEKMIAGMYLGELARLVMVKCIKHKLLFKNLHCNVLLQNGSFPTKYMSEIESDEINDYTNCRETLSNYGLINVTDEECTKVRFICECVSRRAADLCSIGIATLINKMNEQHITVGVDGSVYKYHPHFHNRMNLKIKELINPNLTFDVMLSEDGSGRGAALVAAVVSRERRPKNTVKFQTEPTSSVRSRFSCMGSCYKN